MAVKRNGLGKGLDALFNENSTDQNELFEVKLSDIEPNREQPRKSFDDESINELAASIKERGLLQPIVVKPMANGTYKIIAGERRWRACRIAGLVTVPVVVKNLAEQEVMEVALIENLQRENLNPVEEALGYKSLITNFDLTQEQVAARVNKSRTAVTNALRLLNLTSEELELLKTGSITSGHARALLGAEGEARKKMLEAAINGASVRELEKLAKIGKGGKKAPSDKNTFYTEVELALKEATGRTVKVTGTAAGNGTITISFCGQDDLKDIAEKLGK